MKCLLSLLLILSCASTIQAQNELVPSALIVPDEYKALFDSAHTVLLPKGFVCRVFYARKNWNPRVLGLRPDGVVCVSDNANSQIDALPDADHNSIADSAITIAYEDSIAHGFAFYNGALYTAASSYVRKYEHPNALGVFQDSSIFISGIPYLAEGSPNHTSRTLLFDTVGQAIYLSAGAPCNACREVATERAAILRFNLIGTGRRIYASGLRNAVGLAMDNATHSLWTSVAERNGQGADIPQEFATHIIDQGFYGWPFAYGDKQWDDFTVDSAYRAMLPISHSDSLRVASMQVGDMFFPAHSTPLGIAIYHSPKFPDADGDLFITLHGSYPDITGRIVANGSKIERAHLILGKWIVSDFASGFLTDSLNYKRWARPCGIVIDTAGDLYFSSDHYDAHTPPAVYKISYDPSFKVEPQNISAASLDVFPDPVNSMCRVQVAGFNGPAQIDVVDILGRVVLSRKFGAPSPSYSLDLHELPRGTYIVRIISGNSSLEKKISIEHP
jgi:glucose/arabinose dehydrogenase